MGPNQSIEITNRKNCLAGFGNPGAVVNVLNHYTVFHWPGPSFWTRRRQRLLQSDSLPFQLLGVNLAPQ
jgi:hypothetical protein